MSLLPILHYPDPRLHKIAKPVTEFDAKLKQLAEDMAETMYAAPGIGLAAPQVDRLLRLIVIDISEDRRDLRILVNPQILTRSGECEREEGCLSVPGIYQPVKRAALIQARAQNLAGETFELEAEGLLAVCIQHEVDHLEGKVFVDYLSKLKQARIKAKLIKQARANI